MKTREELIEALWQNEVEYMEDLGMFDTYSGKYKVEKDWFINIVNNKTTKELQDALVQNTINKAERIY